jgi:hypothetical protein
MTDHKVNKYFSKLLNEPVSSSKFGTYLNKLTYWHEQIGSGKKTQTISKDEKIKKLPK